MFDANYRRILSSHNVHDDAGLPGKSSNTSSSLQEMAIIESPPAVASETPMSSGVASAPQGPDVSQLRRRRASMQDALDFTKINASLYERPVGWCCCYLNQSARNVRQCLSIASLNAMHNCMGKYISQEGEQTWRTCGISCCYQEYMFSLLPEAKTTFNIKFNT